MALGLRDQIENKLTYMMIGMSRIAKTKSHKREKQLKHRSERRRASRDPDCVPAYRKYAGWEW